jgi:hypothetical protein
MMQYDESNGNNNQPTTPPTTGEQPTGGCKSVLFVSLSPMLPAVVGAWLFLRKKERK